MGGGAVFPSDGLSGVSRAPGAPHPDRRRLSGQGSPRFPTAGGQRLAQVSVPWCWMLAGKKLTAAAEIRERLFQLRVALSRLEGGFW